ncbi:MAG: alpha/beta fold hydrolase [Kofleriaceae bacterium]
MKHLAWRGTVAGVSNALMFTGVYPLVPHAYRARGGVKAALGEWAASLAVSLARPLGFLKLPSGHGPRPVIVLHGYAMNRANFYPLARRLRAANLGPVFGFEYWTLGRIAAGARQLGWFVDEVRETTGAAEVDIIGHSMGGVVARYYVTLAGGDPHVHRLITLGSPHAGTDMGKLGIGHPARELVLGSKLVTRLAAATPPSHAKITTILSRADALVPADGQPDVAGAERIVFDDLGHVTLLTSKRVAAEIIQRIA